MDLSVIIVSFNVRELLRVCLRSVYASGERADGRDLALEVIVVDSASGDGSTEMVAREFPDVRLLAQTTNVGFTKGNNIGIEASRGRYMLLLNPDTEVDASALPAMVDYMDAHPDVGALGPRLFYPDGTTQSSRRRFPTLATGFLESTILQRYWRDNAVLRRYYCSDLPIDRAHEVDWVVGAALLVRRKATDQVGPMDEGYFMYSEEMDWCYRIKKAGWRMMYLPDARIVHYEGKSSEQHLARRNIHFHESKCRFFAKNYGPWQGALLRAFIFLTFLFQVVEESAKLVLRPRDRDRRRRWLGVLLTVARYQAARLVGLRPRVP